MLSPITDDGDEMRDFVLFDGLEPAFMGLAVLDDEIHAVYSMVRAARLLMTRDDMTYEDALEYLQFNVFSIASENMANVIWIDDLITPQEQLEYIKAISPGSEFESSE